MIKIYYVPAYRGGTREFKLIKQGLVNNPRVELVNNIEESDFVFQFYYIARHREHYPHDLPPEKTVVIDYHDRSHFKCPVGCFVYFKRSWVDRVESPDRKYATKKVIPHLPHYHPLTMAIMDEFIINEDVERDIILSCPLRRDKKGWHLNRIRVLELLEKMDIQGKTQIGEFSKGHMRRFNEPDMREYFKLLKRSRIVITCNPNRWEGDHRTWEAFASGALVFVDRMWTPLKHPLIDGKHCIFYDLSDVGLRELRATIFYYLNNLTEAEKIAKAGHEFTVKYHRTSNRIDEILEVIL